MGIPQVHPLRGLYHRGCWTAPRQNGGFKYFLDVYRGVVGERMLGCLRYDLFVRMLRFALPRFRFQHRPGEHRGGE